MKVSLISGAITFALGVISTSAKVQASDDVERIEVNGWKHERECVINVRSMRQARCFSGGWGDSGGGSSSSSGASSGGGSNGNSDTTAEQEAKFNETANDLAVAAKEILNALEEYRKKVRTNRRLHQKVSEKIAKINMLIVATNGTLQTFIHLANGENRLAISEAMTFVVGISTGMGVAKAVSILAGTSPQGMLLSAFAGTASSFFVGSKFESFMDQAIQQEFNIPRSWSNPNDGRPETVTDIVCGMMSVVHRPDEPPCRGYRSLDTLTTSGHFIALDLAQDGVEWSLNPNTNSITVGSADALLIIDANQNNQLDSASEILFKPFTETQDTISLLDSNQDAILDKFDNNYHYLKVWQDVNYNGVIDDGEVIAAADKSLTIYLDEMSTGNRNQQGHMDVEGAEYAISVIRIGFKHE
ncbi:hypothetical protein [Pseudoalteromonas sp. DY56-GL79]|uniref:hypothetical protein n=1 Tax=Pseudoalteromonas sp. DY56-GL79 TaxID=2967131 RepID=UPI00352AE8D4